MGGQKILQILEENRGVFVSGEVLAAQLQVSRAAVWKMITALRQDGYPIESWSGRGYALMKATDALLEAKIQTRLRTKRLGQTLRVYSTIDSTNTQLRRLAHEGAPEGMVLAADEQTAGKGRLGRTFHSPLRNGVYFSVLLRPRLPFENIHFLTMLAAVCVMRAVKTLTGLTLEIKWVNDLLMDGRKICGILSEAAVEGESGRLDFVVVGIGVNTGTVCDFPTLSGNLPTALGDLTEHAFSRCDLIAEILNELEALYDPYLATQDSAPFLREYCDALCYVGREVWVVQGNARVLATVTGLSDRGGLLLRGEDGAEIELTSGEISLRPKE